MRDELNDLSPRLMCGTHSLSETCKLLWSDKNNEAPMQTRKNKHKQKKNNKNDDGGSDGVDSDSDVDCGGSWRLCAQRTEYMKVVPSSPLLKQNG